MKPTSEITNRSRVLLHQALHALAPASARSLVVLPLDALSYSVTPYPSLSGRSTSPFTTSDPHPASTPRRARGRQAASETEIVRDLQPKQSTLRRNRVRLTDLTSFPRPLYDHFCIVFKSAAMTSTERCVAPFSGGGQRGKCQAIRHNRRNQRSCPTLPFQTSKRRARQGLSHRR